jgi:hypothetical protein
MAGSVKPTDIFPEAAQADALIPPNATDSQALQMAKDFERRGYLLYDGEASRAGSAEERAIWEYWQERRTSTYIPG